MTQASSPARPIGATAQPRDDGVPSIVSFGRRILSSQLRINVASGFVTAGINTLLMLASYPLYLYFLGYEQVGIWLLLSSVQMFAQLGLLGIGPALTKLVAEERGRGDDQGAQRYISLSTLVLVGTGTVALLALWLFRRPVVGALGLSGPDAAIALRLLPFVGILTAFSFLNQVTSAALAGVGRYDVNNYVNTGSKVAALTMEIILLSRGVGIVTLLVGDLVGCAFIHFAGNAYLKRRCDIRLIRGNPWDNRRFRRLVQFAGSMFVATLTTLLISPLNKLALSRFASVALVPVYDISFSGSMQLRGLAELGLRALMPAVSHRGASGTVDARLAVRRLHYRAFKLLLVVAPLAFACSMLLAQPLLKLWLGHRFVPEIVPTFQILVGSALVSLLAVPAYYTLMGTGRIRSCMVSHLIAAAANVGWIGSAVFLRGTISLYTASYAVLVTNIISTLYLVYSAHRAVQSMTADDLPSTAG